MRTAIILIALHGESERDLSRFKTPDMQAHAQLARYKEIVRSGVHEKFGYVELWYSDSGRAKHTKLISRDEVRRRDEAAEQAIVDAQEKTKAEAKAKFHAEAKVQEAAEEKHKAALAAKAAEEAEARKHFKPSTVQPPINPDSDSGDSIFHPPAPPVSIDTEKAAWDAQRDIAHQETAVIAPKGKGNRGK